jgi:hypothetical protein
MGHVMGHSHVTGHGVVRQYIALGNAVSPPVIAHLGRALLDSVIGQLL